MKNIILTGDGYSEEHFSKLMLNGFKISHITHDISREELISFLPQHEAYVLGGNERLTADLLQLAEKMRLISFVGTGYTSFIDEIAAKNLHIAIRNTPDVMAPAVVEHTLGFLLGLQRKIFQQNYQVKNSANTNYHSQELSALCIGVVGMGAIGTRISRILRNIFGSKIIYYSRTRKPELEAELDLDFVSLEQLFSFSDSIIFSLPTNKETEFFVNEALLANVKENIILINTAGARLFEPHALMKYIKNNRIAAVAMDGYFIEPLPKISEDTYGFLSLPDDRFVVTPHTAAKTSQSWRRMIDMAIDNVINFYHA